jgi:hypothetical protein
MPGQHPQTGPRHEPDHTYERAADPAEAANRPLEPKAPGDQLSPKDVPQPEFTGPDRPDPHHRLNTPVGEVHADADSDPYREPTEDDESDAASGVRGMNQGAEDRG